MMKPLHPGEVLREEFLTPLNISANRVAISIGVPATRISEIVHERRAITAETAVRLAQYFDTTPDFWMNLQVKYDLETLEDARGREIRRYIRPLRRVAALSARRKKSLSR